MQAESRTKLACPSAAPRRYRTWLPGGGLFPLRLNPLRFLPRLAREHGDVVELRLGSQVAYLLNDPELIQAVLVTHDRRFQKGPGLRVARRLLGEGLLTSEGDFHRRQRRLAQPAFHRQRVAAYASVMAEYTAEWQRRWSDGVELDIAEEMRGLTLRIAAKTLFDSDVEAEIGIISDALSQSLDLYRWATFPFARQLEPYLPFLTRRFDSARARLDGTVYRMVAERRASGEDRGDLLSMLLLATDPEGDGGKMTDLQLRDEAMTLLLAGHETTANALAWTWYLLSENAEARAALQAEADSVLGGRLPAVEDVPRLPYARMVFAEAMRCYPPAWIIARQAVEECSLGALTIPAGALVLMSQWVTHHDARFFPNPLRFDPERWTPERAGGRPKFSYYPFGGGSRLCIGEQFAWMEGVLVLATLASAWELRLAPGPPIVPQPVLTLRPKHGIRMTAHRRRPTPAAPSAYTSAQTQKES